MRRRWLALATLIVVALGLLLLPQQATTSPTAPVVGLVIAFPDGTTRRECVPYRQNMTGYDVLTASAYSTTLVVDVSSTIGASICKIGDTGCTLDQGCFCQCVGATCNFWSYSVLTNDAWRVSNLGATNRRPQPGEVEGWAWGSNAAPPPTSFNDVCQVGEQRWLPLVIGANDA
jgi:hypothetical protein